MPGTNQLLLSCQIRMICQIGSVILFKNGGSHTREVLRKELSRYLAS